jgi:hypothetical protein
MTHYFVKWKNEEAKGSVDLIDDTLLKAKKKKSGLSHPTRLSTGMCISHFDLEPDEVGILFRYGGAHAEANNNMGIFVGDMRITPAEFPKAKELAWRAEGHRDFEMVPVEIERFGAREGIRKHRRVTFLSRASDLAKFKRADAEANGRMRCEACSFPDRPERARAYGKVLACCFEVHHKTHLPKGERFTEIDDLALLCANCHNAIHRLGDIEFEAFLKRFSH